MSPGGLGAAMASLPCLDTVLWEWGLAFPAWQQGRGGLRTPSPLNKAVPWSQWDWGQSRAQALGTCGEQDWGGFSPSS